MSEHAQSPLTIFQDAAQELQTRAGAYQAALERQQTAEQQLQVAKTETEAARTAANTHGSAILGMIHEAVTEETDPGEYLRAILNTYHSAQPIGDKVAELLLPMRNQMREGSIPIGIVGARDNDVWFGMTDGDMHVRHRNEWERGFHVASGVALEIPMRNANGISTDTMRSEPRWEYNGTLPPPSNVTVVQWLSNLRLAATLEEVRILNETPHAPFSERDTVMHHERDIKMRTGFVPFIAYGEVAVTGLLAALYEGRGITYDPRKPKKDEVLAAAISLGIAPENVADLDVEALRRRLHARFWEQTRDGVGSAIRGESFRRKFPNQGSLPLPWHITAAPQVMAFAEVTSDEMTEAARIGIEGSVRDMRTDDPDDIPSWITVDDKEHRLLEGEARERAVGLLAVRYGVTIDPELLASEKLDRDLNAQLADKRRQKKIHDRVERELSRLTVVNGQ